MILRVCLNRVTSIEAASRKLKDKNQELSSELTQVKNEKQGLISEIEQLKRQLDELLKIKDAITNCTVGSAPKETPVPPNRRSYNTLDQHGYPRPRRTPHKKNPRILVSTRWTKNSAQSLKTANSPRDPNRITEPRG